ncbi:MAG: glycosyltransferase [Prevotella sp.]|nr:glycosyltransferase [Prevotella sp.]
MKIVFITDYTPTLDNVNGPSALGFHLLKELKKNNELFIYSTNSNKVPEKYISKAKEYLGPHFKITPRSFLMRLFIYSKAYRLFSLFFPKDMPAVARYKLPERIQKEITRLNPDLVIVYPIHLVRVMKQMKKFKMMVIGPDCFMLHHLRAIADRYATDNPRYFYNTVKGIKTEAYVEREAARLADYIALVGQTDCILFQKITGSRKSFFLPHPHFTLAEKEINLNKPVLKVVITGAFNQYTYSDALDMMKSLKNNSDKLKNFHFTFIGRNWNVIVAELKSILSVEQKTWVDDYIEEIKKYDIQILPISVGSGTKGKALDALSTGLLCIGSYYAFENIAVTPNESCLIYKSASDISQILVNVEMDKEKYEQIARNGKKSVRHYHNATIIVKRIKEKLSNKSMFVYERDYLSGITVK